MEIYINIDRLINLTGKTMAYHPEVHWTIDEKDTISPQKMKAIASKINDVLCKEIVLDYDKTV